MKFLLSLFILLQVTLTFSQKLPFQSLDVFELEWVSDPQISPDGKQVVYRRMEMSIMKDTKQGNLWIINTDGSNHQKLTSFDGNESAPRWSPKGDRIAFVRTTDQGTEMHVYWVSNGQTARISHLEKSPGSLSWSPDGSQLAFTMTVAQKSPVIASEPPKPKGAKWAEKPRITDRMHHERDGSGYIEPGFKHLFVVPAIGGSARQVTKGDYNHSSPEWAKDGKTLFFTSNRLPNWEYDFRNSEIYQISLEDGVVSALTDRQGPDSSPTVSPHGNEVIYLGYEDKIQTYQVTHLEKMNVDGTAKSTLLTKLDRSARSPAWGEDGRVYFQFDDKGITKIGAVNSSGTLVTVAENLGGETIGRPYGGGSFSLSKEKKPTIAYTYTRPEHPAELMILKEGKLTQITELNADVLPYRNLGKVEAFWWKSSHDQRDIQGWVVTPPDFDPNKKYPLIVEIHGGPIGNYGERFSPEIQLYAAGGYVVFYPNPRGSTGYGEEFGNLLYHNYPGHDFDDIESGVNELLKNDFIDSEKLFVTGGSAGGIMTAWIIGKTNRYRAAAVVKPVMNWYSKTLVADNWFGYFESRYPGVPWTNMEAYMKYSPISLVGNVETPTMVMVGMEDLRTPTSEAKQLYHALKYRKIETVLVEIPGAYHNIANRPSQLIAKVSHILAWFDMYSE